MEAAAICDDGLKMPILFEQGSVIIQECNAERRFMMVQSIKHRIPAQLPQRKRRRMFMNTCETQSILRLVPSMATSRVRESSVQ